ncbi:hypothetical protein Tco_1371850 [Tanacetum coccineum]
MSKPRALGTLSVVASEVCFCVGLQKLTPEMVSGFKNIICLGGHYKEFYRDSIMDRSVRELLELPSTKPAISVMKVVSATGVIVAGAAIVTGI